MNSTTESKCKKKFLNDMTKLILSNKDELIKEYNTKTHFEDSFNEKEALKMKLLYKSLKIKKGYDGRNLE